MKTNPDLQVLSNPSTAVFWTIMNTPRLKSPGVKQGFSYAFPYDEIKDGVYKGLMTRSGPIATAVRGHDPDVFIYQTDLAKAKELILAGGFAEGDTFEYILASEEATERRHRRALPGQYRRDGLQARHQRTRQRDLQRHDVRRLAGRRAAPLHGRLVLVAGLQRRLEPVYPNFAKARPGRRSNAGTTSTTASKRSWQRRSTTPTRTSTHPMKEAQNILTEQDPPVLYYGEALWTTVLPQGIVGFRVEPALHEPVPAAQVVPPELGEQRKASRRAVRGIADCSLLCTLRAIAFPDSIPDTPSAEESRAGQLESRFT